ncbi:PWWP domain-containing protein 5-like isoform X2 [Vicia villosa]|uniref:PWWP domain-containing protein 5-like isoform X2 n=1 Tax=Vicia villosa TaxID=3911 RepID=UPI00273C88CE|nr:PWWP domain-containing protein 5-like isoform X2 [Vicia villosa]
MAENSDINDLKADYVLFDRENEVSGFDSSTMSNVDVSEALIGDVGGSDDSMNLLSGTDVVGFHMNSGCDVMVNDCEKEGFCREIVSGLEDGGMFDGKVEKISCGLVKNEDEKSVIQCSGGGEEFDKDMVFGLNDGVQIEPECENVEKVALSNEVQEDEDGVENMDVDAQESMDMNVSVSRKAFLCDVMVNGCEKEGFCQEKVNGVKDGGMFGVRCDGKVEKISYGLVENEDEKSVIQCSGGGEETDKGSVFGLNDGVQIEQECENVEKVALSNEVQEAEDGVENMDVNAQESLDMNVSISRKAFLLDSQVNVIQNYITGIGNSGEANSEDNRYDCGGLDLVVDLNSYKNTQEEKDNVPSDLVFSDVNYHVSDLVWGKVRGHPWWPGQIYDPSVASEMAKRQRKENCYLIAYFGDQTFAWNEVSMIKPFHKHFSEFEKQSDLEIFRHAVDCAVEEVSRRVEFGLCCPCVPEEVFSKLKTEVTANAETLDQSSRRNGGDGFIGATSFEPAECVGIVKSLAQSPLTEFDRLDFASARAQVSAFNRSKGYSQPPEFAVLGQLFENDMETQPVSVEELFDQVNEQVLKSDQGFLQNSESTSRRGRKPKAPYNSSDYWFEDFQIASNSSTSQRGRKRKLIACNSSDYCFENFQIAGDSSTSQRGRKRKLIACSSSDYCFNNSQTGNPTQLQNDSVDDLWSRLCLVAKDPTGESCYSSEVIHYFAEFGKFSGRNNFAFFQEGLSLEQEQDGETGVITSVEPAATASMPTPMELCNDSYWTDRIIQSTPEEETLVKKQHEREKLLEASEISPDSSLMHLDSVVNLGSEPSNNVEHDTDVNLGSDPSNNVEHDATDVNLGSEPSNNVENDTDVNLGSEPSNNMEHDTDVNLVSEPSNNAEHVNESSPTALTLKFTNFESVPSATDLNQIFANYGPLIESKTVLLEKTNCARVVFKRRVDAESAFSSSGKYSIFGPSLKSYRLKILPPTPEKVTRKRGRKSKKEKSLVDAAAV